MVVLPVDVATVAETELGGLFVVVLAGNLEESVAEAIDGIRVYPLLEQLLQLPSTCLARRNTLGSESLLDDSASVSTSVFTSSMSLYPDL